MALKVFLDVLERDYFLGVGFLGVGGGFWGGLVEFGWFGGDF